MTSSIPEALYAHPDPFLCRLRLNSSSGQPLEQPAASSSELRDAKVIGILFGAEVEREREQYPREFYKSLAEFSRHNPHRFKCIYVSIDRNEAIMKESIRNKGWLSCVWNDGTNAGNDPAALATIANDEDFILDPIEELPDEKLDLDNMPGPSTTSDSKSKKSKKLYKRPYARIALGQKFDVLSTPTLAIYHLESQKFISKRVKTTEIRSDHSHATMDAWLKGEKSPHAEEFAIKSIVQNMKWTLAIAIIFSVYYIARHYGGIQFSLSPILQSIFVPEALRDAQGVPKVDL